MVGQGHVPPLYTQEGAPVPILQEVGRAPGPVWEGVETKMFLASSGIWNPNRPARSESLYRLRCPGLQKNVQTYLLSCCLRVPPFQSDFLYCIMYVYLAYTLLIFSVMISMNVLPTDCRHPNFKISCRFCVVYIISKTRQNPRPHVFLFITPASRPNWRSFRHQRKSDAVATKDQINLAVYIVHY